MQLVIMGVQEEKLHFVIKQIPSNSYNLFVFMFSFCTYMVSSYILRLILYIWN